MGGLCVSLCDDSNGVLQPYKHLGWWKWMYRASPYTYIIEGIVGQGEVSRPLSYLVSVLIVRLFSGRALSDHVCRCRICDRQATWGSIMPTVHGPVHQPVWRVYHEPGRSGQLPVLFIQDHRPVLAVQFEYLLQPSLAQLCIHVDLCRIQRTLSSFFSSILRVANSSYLGADICCVCYDIYFPHSWA